MDWMMSSEFWLTRFCFQRALAFIYLMGFLILALQFLGLCGSKGILPVETYLKRLRFKSAPSLFFANSSDVFLQSMAWLGVLVSLFALSGFSEKFGIVVSMLSWFVLWLLYLSYVNIGQIFYGYGWETMLCETGFLAIFFGSADTAVPVTIVWLYRWLLFRLMFGAGLIKIRGDACWRDLTCMHYHYETQPIPNPLSWYFHRLPSWMHKASVLYNHFVELIVPFFYFGPAVVRVPAALLTILFQAILIVSGNFSWLNYLSIVIAIPVLSDPFLHSFIPVAAPELLHTHLVHGILVAVVTLLVIALSIRPARNLFSRGQMMNASFEPLHLVNTYGAFGSITKRRREVILLGTADAVITPATQWVEYEFKAKPGKVDRMPPIVSPYHLRIDWQMWFAAMSPYYYHPWIIPFIGRLLQGSPEVLKLLRSNPFPESPPKFIRADWFLYHYSPQGPEWWTRSYISEYLPALSLDQPGFRQALQQFGWEI